MMNRYVLDANVFIQAKNDHYGMDFCPAFWDWLIAMREAKRVVSIKAICDELTQQPNDEEDEDDLSKWVKSQGSGLFLAHDQDMVAKLPAVATWANSQHYKPPAISAFFGCADMYVVAFALTHNYTVVTHEKASDSVCKLKIPDACRGLGVKCVKPFDMLRTEGAKFVLGNSDGPRYTTAVPEPPHRC
jgi:hypothetical protein